MALTTYTELKAAIADWLHRDDLTTQIADAIALAETEMQVDCKLVEFEASATVAVTSGVGTLPADFSGARSVRWDSDPDRPLTYVVPSEFDRYSDDSGDPYFYTVTGSSIKTAGTTDGSLILTYMARFTTLSGSTASNAILASYPDAYLYGGLKHICAYTQDDANTQKYGLMFNTAKARINQNNQDRKYAGPLEVRGR